VSKYTVLLVEDHPETREHLANAVSDHHQLQLIAAVDSCAAANKVLDEQMPDVMLTDLGLPDGNGLSLIHRCSNMDGNIEVMVITVFGDEKHVLSAIEAGASGYLLKDGTADYIGDSIVQMVNGQSPVSPAIARHLLKRFRTVQSFPSATESETPRLTPRESEILQYVAKGFSFPEVAKLIKVSPHTVTHHIKNIYKKLAVCSRAEAVYEAMQLGLVRMDT
jgi:DNA-binding NarL/FixJ family response regulator